MKDYYLILGVPQNCSQEDIKKAFHRLAHLHHPDKGGDIEKMKEVNEAYAWLCKNHGKQIPISNPQFGWSYAQPQWTDWNNQYIWVRYNPHDYTN